MKNYVKKHKAHDVPDGAAHYNADNHCFYNKDKTAFRSSAFLGAQWTAVSNLRIAKAAIELPEQDLPNWDDAPEWDGKGSKVGKRVRATAVSSNEWENCLVKFCDKHSDIVVVRFDGHSEDTPLRLPWRFLPLKTADEVIRDMFVEIASTVICSSEYESLLGSLFDAGFTAPKGEG